MGKIYVEVFVAAVDKKYEFIVPAVMKAGTASVLMAQAVAETEGINFNRENLMLCTGADNKIIPNNITMDKAGILDGAQLLLI
ncbi:MAG: hypothetical protein GX351_12070 [Peptococcaceae bacterium]|jgi:hypothetical protein|uniref:hypothetical protein n=1 Tax=Acetivibrio saccincola TaxID=1677857 RepID=UPI00183DBE56|nr:hypothetical protein [Acetivibrio saccincola]NLP45346.1 hypothetical protein [Peptococcaceae bacterium]HQD29051.1 hypothetical protein [Acetivibrio saccincola]